MAWLAVIRQAIVGRTVTSEGRCQLSFLAPRTVFVTVWNFSWLTDFLTCGSPAPAIAGLGPDSETGLAVSGEAIRHPLVTPIVGAWF
jgi:hypothetical protein